MGNILRCFTKQKTEVTVYTVDPIYQRRNAITVLPEDFIVDKSKRFR